MPLLPVPVDPGGSKLVNTYCEAFWAKAGTTRRLKARRVRTKQRYRMGMLHLVTESREVCPEPGVCEEDRLRIGRLLGWGQCVGWIGVASARTPDVRGVC